jgi:uncharacterized repeat protein (TIGR01451 family)
MTAIPHMSIQKQAALCSRRMRPLQAGSAFITCLLLSFGVSAGRAWATVPGFPDEPQPPTIVYSENFENGVGKTPVALTAYTGAPPLLKKYTAASAFLKHCDGEIVEFESNERTKATDCEEVAFDRVRQLAWVLGKLRGVDPTANHAVTAYTDGGGMLPANSVQFETVTPISLLASTRFITFSVDAAETNCKHSHAELEFYLLSGSLEVPTFSSAIDPCTDPDSETFEPPKVGTKKPEPFKAGTFAGNAARLFNGSELGIRMRNRQSSEDGNDASFDNIEVLDATPQLDKSFSPAVLNVGAPSQLTFTITNTSELSAKNGWGFTDTLPSGLVVAAPAAAASTCTAPTAIKASAGDGTISVAGNLAAGMNYCTVTVNVTSAAKGSYTNGPQDITTETGINPPGPATVTFTTNADLQIEKSASPSPATPGTEETYTLQATNKGPNAAEEVVVSDQLPAGLSFVSASPGCEVVEPALAKAPPRLPAGHRRRTTAPGPMVRCMLGEMALGAHVTLTLVAHVSSTVIEGFLNTTSVSSTTPDPNLLNNAAAVDTPVPPETDLAIEKAASLSTVTAGGQVTYTLVVENNGPHDATGVIVLDRPPPGLSVVSTEPSQGTCVHGNGVLCNLGQILDGASAQILVTANVESNESGALTNTVIVAGGQTDPNPANNTALATINVTPLTPDPLPPASSEVLASITTGTAPDQGFSDLRIVKHVDHTTAQRGQRLTYTLEVTNDGLDDDPDVNVTDTWSLPLTVLSTSPTQGTCRTAQSLTCALGTIRRGASTKITILGRAQHFGRERNTARVTGANRDPDLSNNQSSAQTTITPIPHAHGKPPIVTG